MFQNYAKGQLAVLKVQERALANGFTVCFPTVEQRYDMVLVEDSTGQCFKVQVKYVGAKPSAASGVEGAAQLDLRKQTRGKGEYKLYTKDEVDFILVYLPEIDKVVKLEPEHFENKKTINLRFEPSGNKQTKGVFLCSEHLW